MSYSLLSGSVDAVLSGGYCIGCGACSVKDSCWGVRENQFGLYQAELIAASSGDAADKVCPFSTDRDESSLGRLLYGEDSNFDSRIGYYKNIYAGHVLENGYRESGSSGGLVTWVLSRLLAEGDIDGVIHVGKTGRQGELFEYRISETLEDIVSNAKSRYYPVHMDEVLKRVKSSNGRFAFVGVPCFVKAVRLLAENDEAIASRIKYCISIFCGHFKTKAFSEMIAWQHGVVPSELANINFRVKDPRRPANLYSVQITRTDDSESRKLAPVMARDLYGMDWGLGYFKPKACDWCDDIAGETADLACGDAWLPEFTAESGGTNIVVVRNSRISELIRRGIENGLLALSEQSVEKVYESQAGNYRHRQEGLSLRIEQADAKGVWHPKKRVAKGSYSISSERRRIYDIRVKIAEESHSAFLKAKIKRRFIYFYIAMLPYELKYLYLNGRLMKGMAKSAYALVRYIFRR